MCHDITCLLSIEFIAQPQNVLLFFVNPMIPTYHSVLGKLCLFHECLCSSPAADHNEIFFYGPVMATTSLVFSFLFPSHFLPTFIIFHEEQSCKRKGPAGSLTLFLCIVLGLLILKREKKVYISSRT